MNHVLRFKEKDEAYKKKKTWKIPTGSLMVQRKNGLKLPEYLLYYNFAKKGNT